MSEWKEYQLSELADVIMGQSPPSSAYNEENIGLPFLQGCAEFGDDYPNARIYCTDPKKLAPANSILISVRAPVGLTNKSDKEYVIGRGLAAIVPTKGDLEFLYYQLNQSKHKLDRVSQGSTFLAINSNDLNYFLIDAPILKNTQRKIARILSTADAVIEKTQAAIAKYKAIKQGMLHDLFTCGIDPATNKLRPIYQDAPHLYKPSKLGWIPKEWEVLSVADVSENLDGKRIPVKQEDRDKQAKIYPYYGASGIIDYVDDYIFDEPLILLGEDGENVVSRNLPLAFKVEGKYWVNNHAHVLRPIKDISTIEFLCEALEFIDYSSIVSGSAQPKITQGHLSKILLRMPKIEEQEDIGSMIQSINQKLQTEQSYLHKMQQIKAGLMADLLSGKKEVTVEE
ncbi:MAG: hypothetical protein AVO38_13925 [delta proteobacterium ML8_D]|jgi:type I restriction enzyme, S subunit|nr:MAG: hypothetical protein AVO38_13925 [delta proteobacterium ML8_D]